MWNPFDGTILGETRVLQRISGGEKTDWLPTPAFAHAMKSREADRFWATQGLTLVSNSQRLFIREPLVPVRLGEDLLHEASPSLSVRD